MRKDAAENRQKIINAAKKLFKQKNINNIYMAEIAKYAHIGVGTLYRNYRNKSDLCLEIVFNNIQKFIGQENQYLNKSNNSANNDFYHLIYSYLTFKEKENNLQLLDQIENDVRIGFTFYQSDLYKKLNQLIQRVLKVKRPNDNNQSIRFYADMLITMLRNKEYVFQTQNRRLSKKDIVNLLTKLF